MKTHEREFGRKQRALSGAIAPFAARSGNQNQPWRLTGYRGGTEELIMDGTVDRKDMGEGNYKAAREFDEAEAAFAKDKDKVAKAAKDAEAALDSPEAEALEKAEAEGRRHAKE